MKKNQVKLTRLIAAGWMLFLLNGCISIPVNRVYDQTIPESEQSVLKVGVHLKVVLFDGEKVRWPAYSQINIPPGPHTIVLSYFEQEQNGNQTRTYSGNHVTTFEFQPGRIYETTVSRIGNYANYSFVNNGVTAFAVPGENETLVTFTKTGLGDYPSYVHIRGGDISAVFYVTRGNPVREVVPHGTYTLYGSKSRGGEGGQRVEVEAESEVLNIDVIGATLFTNPEIRLAN
ncbi:MAG: DUF2057 domain-containing protein [Spirochaetales bacterium]|jgi:hypothetical protein|nr:DUF2057 domain-containing protein [Spirochaetales bacterium]